MWLNRLTSCCSPLFGLYWTFRLEVEGDPLPKREPLILAPNHTSFLDPWFLSWIFPRRMHHLINREWFEKSTAWNLFFRSNGTVPVTPDDPDSTLKAVRDVLGKNRAICIFPEGGISPDGTLQRFRPGIGWFAAVLDVPVYPVGVQGARDSLPKGARLPKRGTISVRVGRPMRYPTPGPDPSRRETFAFVKAVREEVLRLSGQENSGDATA